MDNMKVRKYFPKELQLIRSHVYSQDELALLFSEAVREADQRSEAFATSDVDDLPRRYRRYGEFSL